MLDRMKTRASSFDYEELLACGRGELFGEGNAQLPLPPMLMFDRITNVDETGGQHGRARFAPSSTSSRIFGSSSATSAATR